MKPHFEHDCGSGCCTFIGRTEPGSNLGVFDVYVSKTSSREAALLIRHSDEGGDYNFAQVEQYRRSVARDPERTAMWAKAIEFYDEYLLTTTIGGA